MPWGDHTGPVGVGALTGRRAGFCAGYPVPGFLNRLHSRFTRFGFGWGQGAWGRGWAPGGWGRGYWRWGWRRAGAYAPWAHLPSTANLDEPSWPEPVDEAKALKAAKAALTQELQAVEKRLAELTAKKPEAKEEADKQ